MSDRHGLTDAIKDLARQVGFARVGIAAADVTAGGQIFRNWLEAGYHGQMGFLRRNQVKRFHPRRLVPGARSVLSLAAGYGPNPEAVEAPAIPRQAVRPFVARYARGRDYHRLLKKRCRKLMDGIRQVAPDFEGRAFVDSAPLAERSLAAAAGVGWIGRNGCLIVPGLGSYVVLAEIVCNLDLALDSPVECRCGDCDACLRACPTSACLGNSLIDARRCLSYLTVEHHGEVDPKLRAYWGVGVFGCDGCQEACPYNREVPPGDPELIDAPNKAGARRRPRLHEVSLAELLNWSQGDWDATTRGSATRRAKFEMLQRNAILAAAGSGDPTLVRPLKRLRDRQPQFTELIDWTLERLS